MKWYRQDVVNSIDQINSIINEIEQIPEDLLEEDKDYQCERSIRKNYVKTVIEKIAVFLFD